MKKTLCASLLLASISIVASSEPWTTNLDASAIFSMANYSDNWQGSESGAINWTISANGLSEKRIFEILTYKSTLKIAFGQTHSQSELDRNWSPPKKSSDFIDTEDIFTLTTGWLLEPFAAFRYESQFYDKRAGLDPFWFNPTRLTESFGVSRIIIKKEELEWNARVGGAFRQYSDRNVFDIAVNKVTTVSENDGGAEFVSELRAPISGGKINYTGRLSVYKAFFYSGSDELEGLKSENYWKTPDIELDNTFSAKITELITVNLYIQMLFDKEISLKARHRETLGLGLTYKLF